MRTLRGSAKRNVVGTDAFTRRGMKVALLVTALFWLAVRAVLSWRAGDPAREALALAPVAFLLLGAIGFGAPRLRFAATVGAFALVGALAIATNADSRLMAAGLCAAAATGMRPH